MPLRRFSFVARTNTERQNTANGTALASASWAKFSY